MALIDDFMPSLGFAVLLSSEEILRDVPYSTARGDMDRLLDQALSNAHRHCPEQAENALFAACAFVDEVILNSKWPGRDEWMKNKLQQTRFKTANAGQEFFKKMESLYTKSFGFIDEVIDSEKAGFSENDPGRQALEVYAACMTLGFRGRYHDERGRMEIRKLTDSNLKHMKMFDKMLNKAVFPETYASYLTPRERSYLKPVIRNLVLFGVPLLLAAGIYASYSLILSNFVNSWLQALS